MQRRTSPTHAAAKLLKGGIPFPDPQDTRIAGKVMAQGLATTAQLRHAAEVLTKETQSGKRATLADVLVRLGVLDEEARRRILEEEKRFGPGARLGPYEIIEEAGRGAMGVVYKAFDPRVRRVVALKVIREGEIDRTFLERFEREKVALARLHHPGIVTLYESGTAGGVHYVAMEWVEGKGLEETKLPLEKAVGVVEEVARAVEHAHERGVIHRDLKPANILLDQENRVRVVDFGLARLSADRLRMTQTGTALGTPAYMAPERVRGSVKEVGKAADIYALGVILYELTTGRLPFEGKSYGELFHKITTAEPAGPRRIDPRYPRDLEGVVLKALEKETRRRYASAGELAEELNRWQNGEPVKARPVGTVRRTARRVRRHPKAAGMVILGAIIVAAGGAAAVAALKKKGAEAEVAREGYAGTKAEVERRARATKLIDQARHHVEAARRALYQKHVGYDVVRNACSKSRPLLEEAIGIDPTLATAHYLLGHVWEMLGWWERAEASWRRTVALAPRYGEAHFHLSQLLLARIDLLSFVSSRNEAERKSRASAALLDAARRSLRDAMTSNAVFPGELLPALLSLVDRIERYGWAGLRQECELATETFKGVEGVEAFHCLTGKHEKNGDTVLRELNRALEIRPKFPAASLCRGDFHAYFHRDAEADRDYNDLLQALPRFVPAHTRIARLLLSRGLNDEARGRLATALALNPGRGDRADIYYVSGIVHERQGNADSAVADYTRALDLDPAFLPALLNRGTVYARRGEERLALADFARALGLQDAPFVRCDRAAALFLLRKPDRARIEIERALAQDPDSAKAYLLRANLFLHGLRSASEAMADLAEVLKRDLRWEAYGLRALIHAREGRWDDALRDANEALGRHQGDSKLYVTRAWVRGVKGEWKDALTDADRALKLDSRNAWAYAVRGWLREKSGDLPRAVDDYTRALWIDKGYFEVYLRRGIALYYLRRFREALDSYSSALKLRSDWKEIYLLRAEVREKMGDRRGAAEDRLAALPLRAPAKEGRPYHDVAREASDARMGKIRQTPSHPGMRTHRTAHYDLLVEGVDAEELGRILEALYRVLTAYFGKAPSERLWVEVYATQKRWHEAMAREMREFPKEAGGYYDPGTRKAYAWIQPTEYFTHCLILQEAVHQFHWLTATGNQGTSARWYTEGLAGYFSIHTWDGSRLKTGVIPVATLEDYPKQALVEFEKGGRDLEGIVSGRRGVSHPLAWMLVYFLTKTEPEKFRLLARRLDAREEPTTAWNAVFGGTSGVSALSFLDWLRKHQQPWEVTWISWQPWGETIEGHSGTNAVLLRKVLPDRLRVSTQPVQGTLQAGLVFGFQSTHDFFLFQIRAPNMLHVWRYLGGQWKSVLSETAPLRGSGDVLGLTRKGDRIDLFLNGRPVKSLDAPGRIGLNVDNCRARFRILDVGR